MKFIDLDRHLIPVAKSEPSLGDDSSYWGKRYGGWEQWPQLANYKRIVILAGAGSGKTQELKYQTKVQRELGRAAFFVRLEELADVPFTGAIDHQLSSTFPQWLSGNEPGWFFLDAVDELKLRGKRLDTAVRSVAKALLHALDRAHIIISSRPTDWDWSIDPSSLADRLRPLDKRFKVPKDVIWSRQLALFAEAGLAETIRAIWATSPADDVCFQLIRLVGEARMVGCADLCAEVAFDAAANDYHRIMAVQALARCGSEGHLARLAESVFNECEVMSEHVCCGFALELFPRYLAPKQLASIIDRTPRPKKRRGDGFAQKLDEFLAACRNASERQSLLAELGRLCRQKPLSKDYERVSARHKRLAEHLGPLVRDAMNRSGTRERPSAPLLQALRVMQWVNDDEGHQEQESFTQLVRRNIYLNRALFWHSVVEDRVHRPDHARNHWQLLPWRSGREYWSLASQDWSWLIADVTAARRIENRRAALVAAHTLVARNEAPQDAIAVLRAAIGDSAVLTNALDELLTPRQQEKWERENSRHHRRWQCKAKIRELRTERNWKAFRDRLVANPTLLKDFRHITSAENVVDFRSLSYWLAKPKDLLEADVVLDWRRLEQPFGQQVAEAYRDGMCLLWRRAAPARPLRNEGGITTPWLNHLAFLGVRMEAGENLDWPTSLSDAEARQAIGHLVLTEERITDELIELASAWSDLSLEVLRPSLKEEWSQGNSPRQLLYHIAHDPDGLRPLLAPIVFELLLDGVPQHLDVYDLAIRIVGDMELDEAGADQLREINHERLKAADKSGDEESILRALSVLFLIDPVGAMKATKKWIGTPRARDRDLRAEQFFAVLFGRDGALVGRRLATMPVVIIEQLYRLCHAKIKPEHDNDHGDGAYSPDARDRAESSRHGILNAITGRPGRPSYDALVRLARDQFWGDRSCRALELARERAEKDGDLSTPWSPKETIDFERKRLAPIKTGDDLMRVIEEVLGDIQIGFEQDDATSRDLLALAPDEDHVQNWFTEQINLRSNGRYHAFREPRVANKKRSDVIVASTSCIAQLAVEIKHGGKGWTVRDLEQALTAQLGGQYLKAENRRHGVLLITNHDREYWVCPDTKRHLKFDALLERLNLVGRDDKQGLQVIAIGLDVS